METVSLPMSLRDLDHELRTPLTGILGAAFLLEEYPLSPALQECLDILKQSANRLLSFANILSASAKQTTTKEKEENSNQEEKIDNAEIAHPWVLLVEDDRIVQLIHKKMLIQLGCHVDIAINGEQALAMATHQYNLIFMDIGLPGMSGIEIAAEIRRRENGQKQKPIIALSAYSHSEIQQECLQAGINEVATKPIDPCKLQILLDKYLPQ